ncbi:hypothetical protein QR680_000416 [Steinernema hermaphroditum]|uniref:T-complex protein 1 subunit alpha n=1 Tax=Steinernema hermaphroditum TaxID=289476 RepID=A0AA39LE22_9BILA|nr:hypothetical protein QR680_000416 [Steinernema hermaphroditum]
MDIVKRRIDKILKAGANVVRTTGGIDDLCFKLFTEVGVMAVKRCKKVDLERVAKATDAIFVSSLANLEGDESFGSSVQGTCEEIVQERISDDELITIKKTGARSAASLILRGANDVMLDEMERSVHDALCVCRRVLESRNVVCGGGAVEAALNVYLEAFATSLASREQLPMAVFADALLVIPLNPDVKMDIVKRRIDKILKAGANVVRTTGGIDDLCFKLFTEVGVMAVKRCKKVDLERVAKATDAIFVSSLANLEGDESFGSSVQGTCEEIVQERISDDELITIKKTGARSAASIILRGANDVMLDEMERSVHDALCVCRRVLESRNVVCGGGAVEAALNVYLEAFATSLASREQLPMAVFADALLVIPLNPDVKMDIVKRRIDKILKAGANVVRTTGGIDDLCFKLFTEVGVMAVKRCKKVDLERVAKATDAIFVSSLANLEGDESFGSSVQGTCEEIVQERISDDELITIKKTGARSAASIILRGANDVMLDEMERSVHDALCVCRRVLESRNVVCGGGAVEAALNVYLEAFATSLASREQLPMAAFADALLVIPKTLAKNAAKDSISLCGKLRSFHSLVSEEHCIQIKTFKDAFK